MEEVPATNPSYDPAKIEITKAEVLEYLRLIQLRLKNNPKVTRKVRGKLAADIKLIEWFETEEDLKYHVALFLEITDGIRSIIERKQGMTGQITPQMQKLNDMHKSEVIKKIVMPPDVRSEFDVMKILADAKKVARYGGMRDE